MEKRIKQCKIFEGRFTNIVGVVYDDGSVDDRLATYYPDELSFNEDEFIGLTKKEALDLMFQKDLEYLRS